MTVGSLGLRVSTALVARAPCRQVWSYNAGPSRSCVVMAHRFGGRACRLVTRAVLAPPTN
eukprot:scaffold94385_cov59-Phaeocystis_antarctica.AAC.4